MLVEEFCKKSTVGRLARADSVLLSQLKPINYNPYVLAIACLVLPVTKALAFSVKRSSLMSLLMRQKWAGFDLFSCHAHPTLIGPKWIRNWLISLTR